MAVEPLAGVEDLGNALQRPDLPREVALLAVRRASGAIRAFCGWHVSQETVTAQVQPVLTGYLRTLWLPTLWLQSITSITENGVVLDPSVYAWRRSGKIVRASGYYWSTYADGVVVSYVHGYPEGDARLEGVRDVCLSAASRLVGNPLRHSSETTGSEAWVAGVAQADATLTDGEREQLGPYALERL
jgi:hypothetical protein